MKVSFLFRCSFYMFVPAIAWGELEGTVNIVTDNSIVPSIQLLASHGNGSSQG